MAIQVNRYTIFSAPADTKTGEGWFYRLRDGAESRRFYSSSAEARKAAERALKQKGA